MQFPNTEDATTALAVDIRDGLPNDPIFADAPVTPAQLGTALTELQVATSQANDAQAIADQKFAVKRAKFTALISLMKRDLNWAEKIVGITAAQLKKIGWDFPAPPKALEAPGQCLEFELVSVNGKSLEFDWKKPKTGGKVGGYKIFRRAPGATSWSLEDAIGSNVVRDEESDFPTGQWEVCVAAWNNEGQGPLSNAVTVFVP